jgi:plasmid stabilization system protein ParE
MRRCLLLPELSWHESGLFGAVTSGVVLYHRALYRRRQGTRTTFVQTVESACLEITADPLRWRIIDGRVRRCLVPRFPYIIYYLVEDGMVYFGALLHSARHPEAFREAFTDI